MLGVVNGLVIGKLRAHPVIWTMAFNFVLSGIVRWLYGGNQIYPDVIAGDTPAVEAFFAISRSDFLGVPIMVLVMLVMFAIGQYVLTRTAFGNQLRWWAPTTKRRGFRASTSSRSSSWYS